MPQAKVPASATVSAVIIRADGTREDVGVIAATYRNPLRQLWWAQIGRRRAAYRTHQANNHQKEGQ